MSFFCQSEASGDEILSSEAKNTSEQSTSKDPSQEKKPFYGGQAVIEGVMMRGRYSWGMAVRRPSGGIARMAYPLDSPGSAHKWMRLPIVRGVVGLYDSLSLGIKALGISANIGMEDAGTSKSKDQVETEDTSAHTEIVASADSEKQVDAEIEADVVDIPDPDPSSLEKNEKATFGFMELAITVLIALALAVGLFVVVPLVVVKQFETTFANPFLFNLVEGIIRIVIFLIYILVVSLLPDLRRVFQYHGAEHKVINAYEACDRSDAVEAKRFPTLHPRCGTGFLLLVMVVAVFVFAIVGKPALPYLVLSRLIGIPVIVGISYEVGIKWAGQHSGGFFARIILWPGMQLQRLTTREPSDDQLEIAAIALTEVMALDEIRRAAIEAEKAKEAVPLAI